ncbi:MAG TPA: F0F1 ATP synthase subunit A [Actinomycetota bacterium]|nr:F0F1 ATP synthase subunit A [Actinomycetota bacterium]
MSAIGILAKSRPPDPFEAPGLEIFDAPCFTEFDAIGIHFCINRVTVYIFLAALLVIGFFVYAAAKAKAVGRPRGARNLAESVVEFVRNQIAIEVIGPEGRAWVPLLTAMFSFIMIGNIFGIIPGIQYPINSRMALPAFLAILSWMLFIGAGLKAQGFRFFTGAIFPPGVPKAMYILVTPIEFISTFLVRPLTLSVRLLANMMAGHLVLAIFFLGTAYLFGKPSTWAFAIPSFALATALIAFEILVAVLQAYIFTILTAVYIAGAIHPEH